MQTTPGPSDREGGVSRGWKGPTW